MTEQERVMQTIRRMETKQPLMGAKFDLAARKALANYGYEQFMYRFEQSKRS